MQCPKCQKVMLDVRAEKTNPKAPDLQCPDASCLNDKGYRTGAWLPKGKSAPYVAPQALANAPDASQAPLQANGRDAALVALYWTCLDEVLAGLKTRALTGGFNGEQIASMTSTLYIARSKTQCPKCKATI